MTIEIGRIVTKIAGRDAGKQAVIIDILDNNHVLIDGQARRRKCNIAHIEPLDKVIKIEKNASHETIESEFKKLGIELKKKIERKGKKSKEKPKKKRAVKKREREAKQEKGKQKEAKKEKSSKSEKKEKKE